jgi:glycosyltransferase involved in cell wall biosynthesis
MYEEIPLTILMPVKDASKFLRTAILQIESNTLLIDEIIVVDDNSSDITLEILKDWSMDNPRVRVIQNSGVGLVSALNLGVEVATNQWVARFDVDDFYSDRRLQSQRTLIGNGIAAIFSDYQIVNPDGKSLGEIPSAIFHTASYFSLYTGTRTPHPSVIFNKSLFEQSGGYLPEEYPAEDLGLWFRMSKLGKVVSVGDSLLNYVVHANSVTSANRDISIQRRREIIASNPVSTSKVIQLQAELEDIFNVYELNSHSDLRKLLLMRDVLYAYKISPEFSLAHFFRILFKISKSLSVKTPRVLWQLMYQARKRSKFRNSS